MSAVRFVLAAAASAAFVTLFPQPAHAQDANSLPSTRHKEYESPQNFALELRGGSYRPEIDFDPNLQGGASPYLDTFGGRRALVAIELDWQVFRIPHLGTIGPGLSVGYTRMSAPARISGTAVESAEKTYLEIIPAYAVGVLRIDFLMRELHIPLVPYGKAGLGYGMWSSSTDGGISYVKDPANPGYDRAARGGTFGTHFAAGLALHLNVFDGQTARNFDTEVGVNHTYIFLEATWMRLNGIAQKNALPIGDATWATGLAFEF